MAQICLRKNFSSLHVVKENSAEWHPTFNLLNDQPSTSQQSFVPEERRRVGNFVYAFDQRRRPHMNYVCSKCSKPFQTSCKSTFCLNVFSGFVISNGFSFGNCPFAFKIGYPQVYASRYSHLVLGIGHTIHVNRSEINSRQFEIRVCWARCAVV